MQAQGCGSYEFGPFRLDPAERTLFGQDQAVPLSPKAFDLLFALLRRAGRIVDKEDLMREVWPETFVEENNLTVNISALRKALGKGSSEQQVRDGAGQATITASFLGGRSNGHRRPHPRPGRRDVGGAQRPGCQLYRLYWREQLRTDERLRMRADATIGCD